MTPCEEKGLKPGQWVWCCLDKNRHRRNLHNEWAMLHSDDGTKYPRFSNGEGLLPKTTNYLGLNEDIDWSQGIHDKKPDWVPGERKASEMTATEVLERMEGYAREAGQSAKALAGEVEMALEIAVKLANPPLLFDRSMLGDIDITLGSLHRHRVPDTAYAIQQRIKEAARKAKAAKPVTIHRGDYILREDIPDEATFDAIVAECERQGFSQYEGNEGWRGRSGWGALLFDGDGEIVWASMGSAEGDHRLTPADLGIHKPLPDGFGAEFARNFGESLKDRPPEWDGKGLPPVGAICELDEDGFHADGWQPGHHLEVLAIREARASTVAVLWNLNLRKAGQRIVECLRPARTERDRVVQSAIDACIGEGEDIPLPKDLFARAYDAGYLRNPEDGPE